ASPARRATSATSRRARVPGAEAEPDVRQRVVHGRTVCLHLVAVAVVAGDLDGAHAAAAAARDALLHEGLVLVHDEAHDRTCGLQLYHRVARGVVGVD